MCVSLSSSEVCAGSSAGAWEPVFLCLYLLGSVSLSVCLHRSVSMCVCLSEACAGSSAGAWESVLQCLYLLGSVSVCVSASVLCLSVCLCLSEACAGSSAGAWESRAG